MVPGHAAGFKVTLLSIEVGSRGMLDDAQFEALKSSFNVAQKDLVPPRSDQGNPPGVIQDMVLQKCHYLVSDYNVYVLV